MQQEQSTCTHVFPGASTSIHGRRFSSTALRSLRTTRDISRQQLAAAVGLTSQSIKLYELDKMQPTIQVADRIAYALGVALDDLLV